MKLYQFKKTNKHDTTYQNALI